MSQSRLGDRTMVEAVSVGTDGLLQTRTLSRSSDGTEDHVAGLSDTIDSRLVSLCLRRMRSTDMIRAPEVLTHSAPHLPFTLGLNEDTVGCCDRLHVVRFTDPRNQRYCLKRYGRIKFQIFFTPKIYLFCSSRLSADWSPHQVPFF